MAGLTVDQIIERIANANGAEPAADRTGPSKYNC